MKKRKFVYIEWCDAVTNAGWFSGKELDGWPETAEWIIKEGGWIIKETKEFLVLASGWKPADEWTEEQFVNLHKIPKTWIKKRKVINSL